MQGERQQATFEALEAELAAAPISHAAEARRDVRMPTGQFMLPRPNETYEIPTNAQISPLASCCF